MIFTDIDNNDLNISYTQFDYPDTYLMTVTTRSSNTSLVLEFTRDDLQSIADFINELRPSPSPTSEEK